MEYLNHKIIEAVCAFRFDTKQNSWDVTKFAEFFNKIKDDGFIKKQEIKPIQFSFQFRPNEQPIAQHLQEGEIQMVFKNQDENKAILLGNNYISFHSLTGYPGWEIFTGEFIDLFFPKYFEIGMGNGLMNAQMIYINQFDLENAKKLSDYLNFVPDMEKFGDGDELAHMFQSSYNIAPNKRLQLKTILNVIPPEKIKRVILECNCIADNSETYDIPWAELAKSAHDDAKNAFISITTDFFKGIIK